MTELALHTPPAASEVAVQQFSAGVQRLIDWADAARAAHTVAQSLVTTSFVPEAFRGKPHEATAAILSGAEVGLSPMASLRSFDVIGGAAAPRAITLRAIVQSLGHEIVIDEQTDTRCKIRGRRAGATEWQPVTWTIDRAHRLGLTSKKNWKDQPQAMLVARATSEVARLIAADAILGIPYTVEEIQDTTPTPTGIVTRAPEKRTVRRTTPPPTPAEPSLDPSPPTTEHVQAEEGITSAQLKKMAALMREVGLADRASALAFVTATINRPVQSRNDLTKDEAHRVIEALEYETTPPTEPSHDDATDGEVPDDTPGGAP